MANAFLIGSGSSSGIRQKPITALEYEALSEAEKKNPYVVWIITDKSFIDPTKSNVSTLVHKACMWEVYKSLSNDDKQDPNTVWVITDKSEEDLASMGFFVGKQQGSQLYNVTAEIDYGTLKHEVDILRSSVAILTEKVAKLENSMAELES